MNDEYTNMNMVEIIGRVSLLIDITISCLSLRSVSCLSKATFSFSDLIEPELVAGCDSNRECPDYTACRNSRCINPCAVDDPCAPSASCKVIGHEPVCTCPDGYIGDPRTRCERKI